MKAKDKEVERSVGVRHSRRPKRAT